MVSNPETFPFMVIGNKSDQEEEGKRVVNRDTALKFVKDLGSDIDHIETSAKDNTNVSKAFA